MRFVLVHGASHGAWCWDLVVPELSRLGHEALAVDLPGHGERADEVASLDAYRDAVIEHLIGGDVLVGHSMGASVVSVAAGTRPDLVGHLTLLAGMLPVEGKPLSYQLTAASIGGSSEAADGNEATTDRTRKFTEDGASFYWDRDGAFECFFHDCDRELVDWAAERLVPQSLAPVLEPISIPKLWQSDLSRSYIICSQDRSLPSRIAQVQARRLGVRPLEIDSSHSPFFSRPAQLAELLVHAAGTTPIGPLVPGEEVP